MAFQQPKPYATQRILTASEDLQHDEQRQQPTQHVDDAQEWILFSPATASTTTRTQTISTEHTHRTFSHSQLSGAISLGTAVQSFDLDREAPENTEAFVDDEDGELDSLDSHLQGFRDDAAITGESSMSQQNEISNAVLPTHDGLGSFRINNTVMGEGIQEHLFSFERFNPRRTKRRRESLELAHLEPESDRTAEEERIKRIEEWRLDQSRALLDEIQKESRRRKVSIASERVSVTHDSHEAEIATFSDELMADNEAMNDGEPDGFWSRITGRVIRNLLEVDNHLLSILFGEALPEDDDSSSTPSTSRPVAGSAFSDPDYASWEHRLLDRVARELGLLINQLSDHPGAFSTYTRVRQVPLPYAGLPIIPEASQAVSPDHRASLISDSTPVFLPTLPTAQPLNISRLANVDNTFEQDVDATPRTASPIHATLDDNPAAEFSREEWEKQIDITMVFRYLRSRFTSRPATPEPLFSAGGQGATRSSQDTASRAARVRQYHPLVSKQPTAERRTFKYSVASSNPILQRRRSSSCASQSTRISGKRNSGSGRHYWDINGSMGSGSLIASTGAMGSWGEV